MNARKIGLLFLILGLGAALETVWAVREHVDVGPEGCRVLGGRFYGPSYSFEETARQDSPGVAHLEITNAFGGVRVAEGAAGEVKVTLRKVVFMATEAEAREFASRITIQIQATRGGLRLTTNRGRLGGDDRVGFETHLDVTVPPGTAVAATNEHGPVEVFDVASATVDNAYEGVRVERVKGPVEVKNRHGDVSVSDVAGSLAVNNRYGDVELKSVAGRVVVEAAHGNVTSTATGDLEVQTSYGDVKAEDVKGDLRVKGEHAGVTAHGIGGNASVETSFNDVELVRVDGEAKVKVEHGEVKLHEVKGAVVAEASYNDVDLEDVLGPAEVTVSHGGLRAERLQKGVRVVASGQDVALDAVQGAIDVEVERGSVTLAHRGPITESVSVRTRHGGIHLAVPAGSRFNLEAEARRGEVQIDVPGLTVSRPDSRRATGSIGGGGSLVKLSADGDVTLEERAAKAAGEL